VTTPPALLLVAHGTREESDHDAAAEELEALVSALGERRPGLPVAGGFTGAAPPSLTDAAGELSRAGATRLAAVPLALVPGGRTEASLPCALAGVEEEHPGLACARGRALGPDRAVLDLLERRLDAALGGGSRTPADRSATTVLLVGRGSAGPEANAEVHRAARLLWEGRGFAGVETAFVSAAAPDVPSGLERCHALGARRVAVLPYFLFGQAAARRLRLQAEGWGAVRPEVEVAVADLGGAAEELADVVLERYLEAIGGPPA
jgi:sirohydrochlorin cobaltochelatase